MNLFDQWNKKYESKGLGDTVSKAISTVSGGRIKECGKCKKRKQVLNDIFPYKI